MRASDVFVLPTLFDAQPTVIMEAMASGLPVVSTPFAGIPDMVEHGRHGLLVEPDDVPALSNALAELLGNPRRAREFGQAGRERAQTEFSITRQVERLADLYDRLISDYRRAS